MSEVRNVPRLRFPGFEGNWNTKKLDQVGRFIGGGTPDRTNSTYWDGEIPWISSSDVMENNINSIYVNQTITHEGLSNSATKKIPKNSVIIVSRVGLGKFAINKVELCTSQDFTNLIPNEDSSYFLGYQFEKLKNKFISLGQGTSIKGFTTSDLKLFKINIPSLSEQQKIAEFLTSVDKRIELLEKKKTLLETYKKGVMKKIFNQAIRFKDDSGNDFPDWEEKKLEDVFKSSKGKGLSKDKVSDHGRHKAVLYGELYTTYNEVADTIKSYTDFDEGTKSRVGDLLVPCSTTTSNIDLANVTAIMENDIRLGGDITILRTTGIDIDSIFYSYYLSNHKKYELAKFGQGTTIVHLYYSHFKKMKVDVPSLEEQIKISNFLSSIDIQIELLETQIDKSKTWKKGLLQKMFV